MRDAKSGQWWVTNPQRALANNSAVYDGPVEPGQFMEEWLALYKSKSGERGIFNRVAARKGIERNMQHRGSEDRQRETEHNFGTNPCSEIVLRDCEFCNLTEMVVRADDTRESLMRKAQTGYDSWNLAIHLTDFRYLSSSWKKNCEDERLLGVSMTGIMDCEITNGKEAGLETLLYDLRQEVVEVNRKFAKTSVSSNLWQPPASSHPAQFLNWSMQHPASTPDIIRITFAPSERTIKILCVLS